MLDEEEYIDELLLEIEEADETITDMWSDMLELHKEVTQLQACIIKLVNLI